MHTCHITVTIYYSEIGSEMCINQSLTSAFTKALFLGKK